MYIMPKNPIHSQWLQKESRFMKTWRERFVVLTPRHIYTFHDSNMKRPPTEMISLRECTGVQTNQLLTGDKQIFRVCMYGVDFNFKCPSEKDKKKWISMISTLFFSDFGQSAISISIKVFLLWFFRFCRYHFITYSVRAEEIVLCSLIKCNHLIRESPMIEYLKSTQYQTNVNIEVRKWSNYSRKRGRKSLWCAQDPKKKMKMKINYFNV